jgi:hypothetical protein
MPPYHPEFGYFCPSPSVRRSVRLALMSSVVGMAIGACTVLSLMEHRQSGSRQNEQTSAFGRTDRAWSAVAQAAALESSPTAASSAPEEASDAGAAKTACEDAAASYLDPKCRLARKHKAHTLRSTATLLAAVDIGHRSAGDREHPASDNANGRSLQSGTDRADAEQRPPASSQESSDQAPASSSKPARTPHVRRRAGRPTNGGLNAFAYAPGFAEYHGSTDWYRSQPYAFKSGWAGDGERYASRRMHAPADSRRPIPSMGTRWN